MHNSHMSISRCKGFAVIIGKMKVTGSYMDIIHNLIHGAKIMTYWNEQGRFPVDQNSNID